MVVAALGTIGRERRGPRGAAETLFIALLAFTPSIARTRRLPGGSEWRRREAQLA